ncbi:TIGR02281 family clan AA aspartic protease [Methylobacterium sp. M6A4_1b]
MTRPIVWALGVTAAAAIWAVGLADRFQRTAPESAAVATPLTERSPPPHVRSGPGTMTLFADAQGHFSTDVVLDGQRLRMLVDTGATTCAFTYEDAERAGLRVSERDFRVPVQTANGVAMAAAIRVREMRIGTITVQGVNGLVMPRGRLTTSLLGMSFLKRLNEFSMNGGRLTLRG